MRKRELVWPSEIRREFRIGTQKALLQVVNEVDGSLEVRSDAPEVIMLPLRSGPLAASAFLHVLRSSEVRGQLPQIIKPEASRALMAYYIDYMDEVEDDEDPMLQDYYFEGADNVAAFNRWLDSEGFAEYKRPIYRAAEELKETLGDCVPERVLVVDDLVQYGTTSRVLLASLIRLATGSAPVIEVTPIFKNISWDHKIIQATFPEIDRQQELFLIEVLRGTLNSKDLHSGLQFLADIREREAAQQLLDELVRIQGSDFIPISTRSLLLLDRKQNRSQDPPRSVYRELKQSLGFMYLRTLHHRLISLFLAEVPDLLEELKSGNADQLARL